MDYNSGMQGNDVVAGLPLGGAVFVALFVVAFWCLTSYVSSMISGWHALAQQFRYDREFDGEQWRFCSGWLRWRTRYGGVLVLGANHDGLYMRMLWMLRFGHPSLLIPWNQITVTEASGWVLRRTEFVLGRDEQIPLRVYERVGERILALRPSLSTDDVVKEFYSRPGLNSPKPIE